MGNMTDQLLEGMDVYDVEGFKVGKVIKYDLTLGYVETLGMFTDPRFIPFFAIESIGPAGAHLNVTKEVVGDIYNHLPRVTPDITPGGRLTGTGTLASGHTGRPVPLDAEGLRIVHDKIHNGTTVLDADDKYLGEIQAYDGNTGYMRIEKDGLTVKNIFLPVTSVSFLDDDGIHLSEAKDTIMNRYSRVPEIAREFFA